jgi:hypothetical protein
MKRLRALLILGSSGFIGSVVDCGTVRCVSYRETGLPLVALVPLAMQDPIGAEREKDGGASRRRN